MAVSSSMLLTLITHVCFPLGPFHLSQLHRLFPNFLHGTPGSFLLDLGILVLYQLLGMHLLLPTSVGFFPGVFPSVAAANHHSTESHGGALQGPPWAGSHGLLQSACTLAFGSHPIGPVAAAAATTWPVLHSPECHCDWWLCRDGTWHFQLGLHRQSRKWSHRRPLLVLKCPQLLALVRWVGWEKGESISFPTKGRVEERAGRVTFLESL